MDEKFRRAIRRMTGTSLLGLGFRLDRASELANLSQSMDVRWSIALYEHLDAAESNPEEMMAGSEMISNGTAAWKLAAEDFPIILEEYRQKFEEFRAKWMQRFATEEITRMLSQNQYIIQDDHGWYFSVTAEKLRNLYFSTIHLMVGDAEKLLVNLSGRVEHMQDKLARLWYRESAVDSASKILPSLEAALRSSEYALTARLRASLANISRTRFMAEFKPPREKPKHFQTARSCAKNVGANNANIAYENAFLAFTDDFCDYAQGITLFVGKWYRDKWLLYLRGFSRGQLDLFTHKNMG